MTVAPESTVSTIVHESEIRYMVDSYAEFLRQ